MLTRGTDEDGDSTTSMTRPRPPGTTVFLSSATYTGDLGGIVGADEKCNTLAKEAGWTTGFKAFVFTEDRNPYTDFDFDGTVCNAIGDMVANNFVDMFQRDYGDPAKHLLQSSIAFDETGTLRRDASGDALYWVGCQWTLPPDFVIPGDKCSNFGEESFFGVSGNAGALNVNWLCLKLVAFDIATANISIELPNDLHATDLIRVLNLSVGLKTINAKIKIKVTCLVKGLKIEIFFNCMKSFSYNCYSSTLSPS